MRGDLPTRAGTPPRPARGRRGPLGLDGPVLRLLGGAVAVREWQDQRFKSTLKTVEVTPFPLKSLPLHPGGLARRGGEGRHPRPRDREDDRVDRPYRAGIMSTSRRGPKLTVMVTFGRAEPRSVHVPEVCMPVGRLRDGRIRRRYPRSRPGTARPTSVRRSSPNAGPRPCARRSITRSATTAGGPRRRSRAGSSSGSVRACSRSRSSARVVEHERRDEKNPTEQFLATLLPQIEGRIPGPQAASSTPAAKREGAGARRE